ncbi:BspA family leucine-rich repeat surface protein [Ekhidna sp.]|uniref:BspA family leucine-rich repeat surface protein n=1 Tax=Ekhidna sp. TaxID=2608089 RepID=UPI003B50C092
MHTTTLLRKFRYILFCFIFLSTLSSFAQSGPGGVDFSALWLRADSAVFSDAGTTPAVNTDPVVQWNDVSGVGNNASVGGANPTFQIGGQNGRPYLSFSDDDMDFALDAFAFGSADRSVFVVAEYPSTPGSQQYFFSYGPNVTSQRYSLGVSPSDELIVEIQGDGITSVNTVAAASPFIFSTIYPFGGGALNTSQIFINGTNSTHTGGAATPATVLTSGSVGALADNAGLQFNGDIYEVIYYDAELNDAARTIVENYLSAKYDIPISNDLYAGDLIPSGDFDFDVIGIGRDAGADHFEGASGGLKLADDSFLLDDGDYVFAGHSGTPNGFATTDLPANHNMRLARDWYIDISDATSNGGTINLEFDLAEMGLSVPTDAFSVVLITRPGTSGAYTEVMMDTGISGDIVEFYGVDVTTLVDGHKYTVAFATENALNFDGTDDDVSVPHDPALNLVTGDFTMEAWVYWTGSGSNTILSKGDGNGVPNADVFVFARRSATSKLSLELVDGGSSMEWGDALSDIPLNTWTHVAVSFDNSTNTATFYQNGQFDGTHTFGFEPSDNADTQPMYIGRQGNTCNCNFWTGNLDEVRIWNTARTQQQIANNAYNTILSSGTLLASYDFNQGVPGGNNGTITSLPDLTPNLNNGTLQGPFALSGNTSNWVSSTAWNADVFPPVFLSGYPLIDNISTTGFDITVQLNEPGAYFYVVVNDGSPAPTIGEVTTASATGQVASGNIAVTTPATDFVLSPTGLTPNTFYDLYIVAQDDEGSPNIQIANTALDVATEAGFITRWITSDGQITIPTSGGGYNYSVEWNNLTNPDTFEGFIDGRTGDYTITGMENGSTYEVIIRGAFPRIYFNNAGDKDKIQTIEQWGDIAWTSMQGAFFGCTNLDMAATDAPDLSAVTSLGQMFRAAGTFSGDLSGWDVSTITDMSFLFSGTSFNGNITGWDVSTVANMSYMFYVNPVFNQDISGWVTSSATNMTRLFSHANAFNQNIGGWDVSGVTNMYGMFNQAYAFNQDISSWNVALVTNMEQMFRDATAFNANISGWNVATVSTISRMFQGATSFNQNLSGWDVNATDLNNMFNNATAFDWNIGSWDVTAVTNMTAMLDNSGISVVNYDSILNGWAAQSASLQVGVTLGATGLGYSSTGETDRITLTSAPSSWTISGDQLVPAAPTNLVAYAISDTEITLEWIDNATSETGYLIERADDYAFTVNVTPVLASEPADTDSVGFTVGTNQPYYYRVTPVNGVEDASSQSSIEFATTEAFPGSAIDFSGSTASNVRASSFVAPSNNWTYEFWFQPAANLTSASPRGDFFDHVAGDGTPTIIFNRESDGTIRVYEPGFTPGTNPTSTLTSWEIGKWYHLAGVYDGTNVYLYIDGVLEDQISAPGITTTSSDLVIGNSNSLDAAFDGVIDEFRVWDIAKSDFSDRFTPLNGNELNLVAYHPFDEGTGATTVVDASVNTNDGTVNGATFNSSTIFTDGIVVSTNDSGPGSLREAINYANANPGTTITFDIAGAGPWVINLSTALPQITANNTIIDGTTQPGWTFGDGSAMVTIDGSSVPVNNHGIDMDASGVEVYGMIVTGFTGGTTYGAINLESDVADNVIIGGNAVGNIIHGNGVNGIYIDGADGTIIQGNWLGTVDGSSRSENTHHGISITGTADNITIGGDFGAGLGNVISGAGNGRYGILTAGGGVSLLIRGNYIGTDATGNVDLHNEGGGVNVGGSYTFTIGGVGAGEENVISGNNTDTNADGINIGNSATGSILNNKIGVGANGSTALGNGGYGIIFANSASNVLVDGNTISDNGTDGIYLGNGSSGLTVSDNRIGLTTDGLTALGNTNDGVRIGMGTNITISGNTISANGSDGIVIGGDQTNLDINTNVIGLNFNGEGDMVLDGDGVTVTSDNTFGNQDNGIVLNLVDGSSSGNSINGNLISGNGVFADENTGSVGIGIYINADTRGFTIQDNVIGLEGDEVTPQKNINSGIYINGLTNSVIGGTGANESNLIAHNGDYGIEKLGTHMNGIPVFANEFVCNEKGGISFTSTPDIDAPVITSINSTTISGTTTAEDNSNISIYEADSCGVDQGKQLVLNASNAVSGGNWSATGTFDVGKNYVVVVVDDETAINATLSISEFSTAASIPPNLVVNTNDAGPGSLREVINYANANPGTTITFDIPGGGPWVINLATELPDVTAQGTIIDGTTQPGWNILTANMPTIDGGGTLNRGLDYKNNYVELYGVHMTNFDVGVMFNTGGTDEGGYTFGAPGMGNIFTANSSNGIQLLTYSGGGNIQSNYFGILPDGTTASLSNGIGINIGTNGDKVQIGGLGVNEGNVVANNTTHQIGISNADSVNVQGNIIGLSADEMAAPGVGNGISISSLNAALIEENVIAGVNMGIRMSAANTSTIIRNNIGVASDSTTAFGNVNGIRVLTTGATNNFIGSNSVSTDGNIIAYSSSEAILFDNASATGNQIQRNEMFGNTAGIVLNGSHNGIVPPSIDPIANDSTVTGTGTNGDEIDLYLADSLGHGEKYLGSATVAGGVWSIGTLSLLGGDEVVATTTNAGDGSSTFSSAIAFNSQSVEDFETFNVNASLVTLTTGDYHMFNGLVDSVTVNSGSRALRLDNMFDASVTTPQIDGDNEFIYSFAITGAGQAQVTIEKSVDGGDYIVIGTPTYTNTAFLQDTIALAEGVNSSVRLKFTLQSFNSDQSLVLDDFIFGDYTGGSTYPPIVENLFAYPDITTTNVDIEVDLYSDLYFVATQSNVPPTSTQVKNGQDETGSAAYSYGSLSGVTGLSNLVLGLGNLGANDTAFVSGDSYYLYWVAEENTNPGNISAVDTASFTTLVPSKIAMKTEPVPGGSIDPGSVDNIIYKFSLDVADTSARMDGFFFTPIVSDTADFDFFRFYESVGVDDFGTASKIDSTDFFVSHPSGLPNGSIGYIPASPRVLPAGQKYYYYVTVDVSSGSISGDSIQIDTPVVGANFAFQDPKIEIDSGLVAGNVFAVIDSMANYALEFDGSAQYVTIADAPPFNIDTDWTIEAWIKTPSTGQQNIVTQVLGNTGYAFFKIGGTLYLQYYSSGGFQNGGTSLSVAAGIDDDQWHHVAVSQNGSNGKIYVDGSPVLDVNVLLPIDETSGEVRFGYDPFVGAYTGGLEEVRFWNYQRSDAEILANYDAELNGNESGLMAYYPLNDGPPSTLATDATGNGNDGTLTSMDENTDWIAGPTLNPPNPSTNYALEFDGVNDYLNAADAPQLEVPTEITIEVWVKRTRLDGIDIILEKGGDWTQGETNYGMGLHNNANNNMFYFFWNGGGRGTDGVADLNWHHYAVVAQEGNPDPELYIDGVLQTIDHTFGNATIDLNETTTKDLHIGSQLDPGFDYFGTNVIDEIRIWDYARSQAEIQNDQNNMLFGNEAGLVAYYPMADGPASATATDLTGGGNDATLVAMDVNTDWVVGPTLNPPVPAPTFFESFDSSPLPTTSTTGYFIIEEIWNGQGVLESDSGDAVGATGNAMQIEASAGNYLQTPAIDMGNTISFGYKGDGSGGNTYEVFASSDGGTTFDIPLPVINPTGTYQQYSEALPSNYVGPVRISYSSGTSPLFVDDMNFDAPAIRTNVTVTTLPVGDQTYPQGEQDALIYKFQADIANTVGAFEGLYLVISGADSLDFELDGFKYYQNVGTDDFGSAVLIDSSSWSPGLPVPNGTIGQLWTDFYPAGTSVYYYVTADISSTANTGTFTVDLPDIDQFAFHDAEKFDGGLTAGDSITIQTPAIPDATFTTIPVTGGNLTQGTVDNLVYKFTIGASGGTITKEGMIVAVGGDAVAADFSTNGWKLYESVNTDTGIGGASLIGSTNIGDAAPDSVGYLMSGDIQDGDTHYYYIAVDIDAAASVGNTFNVVLWNGDPTESVGISDPKNKVDGGFVDGNTFTIVSGDVTSPTPVITSSESSPTNANPIPIAIDFGEVVVGFDSTDLVVGNGSAQSFVDVDGQNYTFEVVPGVDGAVTIDIADSLAQDLAGNENLEATQFSIDYDGSGPSITLDQDGLAVNDTNLSGTISDSTDVIQVSVDGGTTLTLASNEGDGTWTYDLSSDPNFVGDGVYTIYLDAADTLGNQTIESTGTVTIDQTGPAITFDQDGLTINDTNLSGTTSDTNDVIQISIDAGTTLSAVTNNGDGTWTYDLSSDPNYIGDGAYSIYLDAIDSLGNQTIESTGTVTIDQTGPVIAFDQDGQTTNDTNISGTVSDPTDFIQLSLDAGTTLSPVTNNGDGTWSSDLSTDPNFVGDGAYSIYLDAMDTLGNQTINSTGTISIDQTAPNVEVDIYATSIISPQITGTIDDLAATIEVTVNGETNAAANVGDGTWLLSAGVLTDLTDGTYDVSVSATDLAGNVGADQTIDELVISQDIVAIAPTQITATSFRANWSEGLDVLNYELDVSTESDFSSFLPGFESLNVANTNRSFVVTGLDFASSYYYRVRLVNTSSQVSSNSNTRSAKTIVDSETLADSLALVQIHDAINPQGLNWGTARLRAWDGVTLDANRTRVNVVNISSSQSAGDMPNPFTGDALTNGGLSNMTGMDISVNEITGLMDFSTTTISTLLVNDNMLEFDDIEPLVSLGIGTLDYTNQGSVQYNQTTDGNPIEVRYANDYTLSLGTDGQGVGGSANDYAWFRNDVLISSGTDFGIAGPEVVLQAINYDNMGEFRTEVTSSLVPGLVIEADRQIVWAVADMVVSVVDGQGDPLEDPIDGYMLEAVRRSRGFDTLEVVLNAPPSTITFPDVVLGNYITAINSNPALYIPTYFGDVFEWGEADTLFFRSDDVITMKMTQVPDELTEGPGSLEVLIEEDFGDDNSRIEARRRASKRKCGLRRKRSGGRTGQDDDEFELIAYGETDENGEFKFGFLPQGTYRFFVEYPGIPLDESSFVQFDVGEEGVSDTDFRLQAFATEDGIEVEIEAVLGVILEYFKNLQIFPNPSRDYLNIKYRHLKSGDVTAQLVDLAGNTMWSTDLRDGFDGDLKIEVSNYDEGIYILRFYDRESPKENVVSFRVIVRD